MCALAAACSRLNRHTLKTICEQRLTRRLAILGGAVALSLAGALPSTGVLAASVSEVHSFNATIKTFAGIAKGAVPVGAQFNCEDICRLRCRGGAVPATLTPITVMTGIQQ